jgi:hypothetical protein
MISALCGPIPDPCEAASFRCYLGKPAGRKEWFNATPTTTSNPSRIRERNALLHARRKAWRQRQKDACDAMRLLCSGVSRANGFEGDLSHSTQRPVSR